MKLYLLALALTAVNAQGAEKWPAGTNQTHVDVSCYGEMEHTAPDSISEYKIALKKLSSNDDEPSDNDVNFSFAMEENNGALLEHPDRDRNDDLCME